LTLLQRVLLGEGPRVLEHGVLDLVVETDRLSLEWRRDDRDLLRAGLLLPMLAEIL
jgi:hypothetical protein